MTTTAQSSTRECYLKLMLGLCLLAVYVFGTRAYRQATAREAAISHFKALGAHFIENGGWGSHLPNWLHARVPIEIMFPGSVDYASLLLDGAPLGNSDLDALTAISELQYVAIESPEIGDRGIQHLSRLRMLSTLALKNAQVTDAGLKVIATWPKLKTLTLNNTKITVDGVAQFEQARPDVDFHWTMVWSTNKDGQGEMQN